MTTDTYSAPIDHSTDAAFRAWGSAYAASLTASGLVHVVFPGQIDWTSVVRTGPNSDTGFMVFRFDDALQATVPIFIRFDFGTDSSSATRPRIRVTIGRSTNGVGVIGDVILAIYQFAGVNGVFPTAANYTTRACHVPGFFGVMWGLGAASGIWLGGLFVYRSTDSSGTPTGDQIMVYRSAGSGALQGVIVWNAATNTILTMDQGTNSYIPGGVTSSYIGADAQAYKHYYATPRGKPTPFLLTVLSAEIGNNTQFKRSPVGGVEHNYVSSGTQGSPGTGVAIPAKTNYVIAMIYE